MTGGRSRRSPGAGLRPGGIAAPWTVLATVAALGACDPTETGPTGAVEGLAFDADQVTVGLEYVMTVDGVRQAELQADTAYQWNDSTRVMLRGMRLTVFHEDGRQRAVVIGREGILDERSDELEARGDVVLTVVEGNRRIESPVLYLNPNSDRIWSDTSTVITQDGNVMRGTSFEADLGFRRIELPGASGTVILRSDDPS